MSYFIKEWLKVLEIVNLLFDEENLQISWFNFF